MWCCGNRSDKKKQMSREFQKYDDFENYFDRSFRTSLSFLHISGVYDLRLPECCRSCSMFKYIWNIPMLVFYILFLAVVLAYVSLVIATEYKKTILADTANFLIYGYSFILFYRARSKIQPILKRIAKIFQVLRHRPNVIKIRLIMFVYAVMTGVMFGAIAYYNILEIYLPSENPEIDPFRDILIGRLGLSLEYCLMAQAGLQILGAVVAVLASVSFIGYYTFNCENLKACFAKLVQEFHDIREPERCKGFLEAYDHIVSVMLTFDSAFCQAAFFFCVVNIFAMFLSAYTFIFVLREDKYLVIANCALLQLSMIILQAALVVEKGYAVRNEIRAMLGRIPPDLTEIIGQIKCRYKLKYSLTLWKMYDIDRVLLFECLGALASYVMLLASL